MQLYGPEGVGKSSVVGRWMADLTREGFSVIYAVVEEEPELMADRIWLCGGERSRAHYVGLPAALTFPSAIDALFESAAALGAIFIYVDSLFSHLDPTLSSYATDDMRRAFDQVGARCVREGRTLLANYHVTKAGVAQSNQTLRQQARVVMRAHEFQEGICEVVVAKSNYRKPGFSLQFPIVGQSYEAEAGTLREVGIALAPKRGGATADEMLSDYVSKTAPAPVGKREMAAIFKRAAIKELLTQDPARSKNAILREIGGKRESVFALIDEIRTELGLVPVP